MNGAETVWVTEDESILVVNCTPHPIRFQTALGIVQVPESGYTLAAEPQETLMGVVRSVQFVKTEFIPSKQGLAELDKVTIAAEETGDKYVIVGSIISAQAYPEKVVSLVPVPGSERAKPADKLYRVDKWNVF